MFIVVSYDVPDDKRRTKIFKLLKNYGQWMQFSVFECRLTLEQFVVLRKRLENLVNAGEDSIRLYIVCAECQRRTIRIGGETPREETVFLV